MVQSPESTSLSTQRKRRRDDIFPDTTSTSPWNHNININMSMRPLHLLTTKFTSGPTPKLKSTRPPSPPRSLLTRQSSVPRSSPKIKRLRASPGVKVDEEDRMQISSPTQSFSETILAVHGEGRTVQPERCHVCSRVQSLIMPSFGTVTLCAVCEERTCYVCTRKCDSCDGTVCSRCSEEKEVHSFCRRCWGFGNLEVGV